MTDLQSPFVFDVTMKKEGNRIAWWKGLFAYHQKKRLEDNPYTQDTVNWFAWRKGFKAGPTFVVYH